MDQYSREQGKSYEVNMRITTLKENPLQVLATNMDIMNTSVCVYTRTSLFRTVWDKGVPVTKKCP